VAVLIGGNYIVLSLKQIADYVIKKAEKLNPPDDIVAICHNPNDGRFWIDVLSNKHATENDNSEWHEPPDQDPVFEQFILVPSFRLQQEAPEFWEKYCK
jgi:hypothetical protein